MSNYKGPISRLRKEITKLNNLTESAASLIQRHLEGEDIPKERVNNAKWVLSTLREYYETAVREENVRVKKLQAAPKSPSKPREQEAVEEEEGQEEEQEEEKPEEKRPFSTKYEPPEEPEHDPETDF